MDHRSGGRPSGFCGGQAVAEEPGHAVDACLVGGGIEAEPAG
jgi:hypothetical protein